MLQTFIPQSGQLQKHVDFFYVFNHERSENVSYIAFPHVNTAISFFKGVDIDRGDFEITIQATQEDKSNCVVEILGKYTQPVFVNYIGKSEEIAIVFKPLGANHFFQNDLIDLSPGFSQELKDFRWTEFSNELFKDNSLTKKMELLETFLLSHLNELENKKLYDALKYLEDIDTNYSIEKIAVLCGFTLKTFQRNFAKHLTCSPLEYKRIFRFRHSLQNKLISNELRTLTRISHDANFYDQSYFIREYKKLTQLNPKSFFESITALNEKKIVWKVK